MIRNLEVEVMRLSLDKWSKFYCRDKYKSNNNLELILVL